jgi:hypothetical protein
MRRFLMLVSLVATAASLPSAGLPVTAYTVIARVSSYEQQRVVAGTQRYSLAWPHGNEATLIATIVSPESLAGREIAIPFESPQGRKALIVKKGTVFRFEHTANLNDLRDQTDWVRRRVIDFPARGIVVVNAKGRVLEAYEGSLTGLAPDQAARRE